MSNQSLHTTQITNADVPLNSKTERELQQGNFQNLDNATASRASFLTKDDPFLTKDDQGQTRGLRNQQPGLFSSEFPSSGLEPNQTADLQGLPLADTRSTGQLHTYGMGMGSTGDMGGAQLGGGQELGGVQHLRNQVTDVDKDTKKSVAQDAAFMAQQQLPVPETHETWGEAQPKQGLKDKISNLMTSKPKDQLEGSELPRPAQVSEADAQLHLNAAHQAASEAQELLPPPKELESTGEKMGWKDKISNLMTSKPKDHVEGSELPRSSQTDTQLPLHEGQGLLPAPEKMGWKDKISNMLPSSILSSSKSTDTQPKPTYGTLGDSVPRPKQVSDADAILHLNAAKQAAGEARDKLPEPEVLTTWGEAQPKESRGLFSNLMASKPTDHAEGSELPRPAQVSENVGQIHLNAAHQAAEKAQEILPAPQVLETTGEKKSLKEKLVNLVTPKGKEDTLPHPKEVSEEVSRTHFLAAHDAAQEAANRLPPPLVLEAQGEKKSITDHVVGGLQTVGSGIANTASSALENAGGATHVGGQILKGVGKVGLAATGLVLETAAYAAKATGRKVGEALHEAMTKPAAPQTTMQPQQMSTQQPQQPMEGQQPLQPKSLSHQPEKETKQPMGGQSLQPKSLSHQPEKETKQPEQKQPTSAGGQEVLVTTDTVTTTTTTPTHTYQVTEKVTTILPTDLVDQNTLQQIREQNSQPSLTTDTKDSTGTTGGSTGLTSSMGSQSQGMTGSSQDKWGGKGQDSSMSSDLNMSQSSMQGKGSMGSQSQGSTGFQGLQSSQDQWGGQGGQMQGAKGQDSSMPSDLNMSQSSMQGSQGWTQGTDKSSTKPGSQQWKSTGELAANNNLNSSSQTTERR